MNVNKWGPGGWTFLHTITFNYPLEPDNDDKNRYKFFFSSVSEMLPCKYCRDSFKTYIKFIPIDEFLESRIGVTYWLYRIHQLVDEKVFKKNDSFENVIRKYENFRAKCGKVSIDEDKDKQYKSCQKNVNLIDVNYLNDFLEKSYKFKLIFDKKAQKLYESDENPNKEYLEYIKKNTGKNKIKITYS